MSSTTAPEEIERQHRAALEMTRRPPIYGEPPLKIDEIPLEYKIKTTRTVAAATEQPTNPSSSLPCWSSRGHVDVSKLADLVRLGYDDICKPPLESSGSISSGDEKKTADDATTTPKQSSLPAATSAEAPPPSNNLWHPQNASKYNVAIQRPSHDAWGIGKIMLVFCDDFMQTTYEFPYFRDKFCNLLEPIYKLLHIHEHQVVRLLLASLPPGVTIPVHQDSGNWVQHTHRVHIPILVQNPDQIVFSCGHELDSLDRIPCTPGHVFEINNAHYHAVSNCDSHHRVHMILDYMDCKAVVPERIVLRPNQVLLQTRRSIDLLEHKGRRPTPSFLILGAQKAGTTSLYESMMQHPLIIAPKRRETHLFDWRWISEVTNVKTPSQKQAQAWMHKFFHTPELQRHPSCLTGDSTPSYLLDSRRVIPRLQHMVTWPLKFLVMVRNPIRRAESHYAMATSTTGTEAQLQARGMEWRDKTIYQVVQDELKFMKECGLIPYFDIETGIVDEQVYSEFAYSQQETTAWDKYLQAIPLNTGSHCLIGRGLYELNLRPWLQAFERQQFMVIQLEKMTTNVHDTLDQVWKHLDIPPYDIEDVAPKNQRQYDRLVDEELEAYLERFYAPHNRRLGKILGDSWKGVWENKGR